MKKQWVVYILRCADDSFYTGITNDLKNRVRWHNKYGTKYTRARRPVKLVWYEFEDNMSDAMSHEYKIKEFPRALKEQLIRREYSIK